jgi:MFS family permease
MKQMLDNESGRLAWSRDLRLAVGARSVSLLGDSVTVAALTLLLAGDDEPLRLTGLLAAYAMPTAVLAGVAGRLVDRYDSRALLVGAGLLQVLAATGLAVLADPTPGVASARLVPLLALVVVLQAGQTITAPTWGALVPRIVGEAALGRAIGVQASLGAAAGLAGLGLGGLLFDRVGLRWALGLDAVTFAGLVVAALAVRTRRTPGRPAAAEDPGPAVEPAGPGALPILRADPVLRWLLPAVLLLILAAEATNVVESLLVTHVLDGSGTAYGLLGMAFSGGLILGSTLAGRLAGDRARISASVAAAGACGVAFVAMGAAPSLGWLAAPSVVAGVGFGGLNAATSTVFALRTPDAARGRVMAAVNGGARAVSLLAILLVGVVGQAFGARAAYVILGVATLATGPIIALARRGLPGRSAAATESDQARSSPVISRDASPGGRCDVTSTTSLSVASQAPPPAQWAHDERNGAVPRSP